MLESVRGSRDCSWAWSSGTAEDSNFGASVRRALWRLERGEGVLAGEDFCGDMDLARSGRVRPVSYGTR